MANAANKKLTGWQKMVLRSIECGAWGADVEGFEIAPATWSKSVSGLYGLGLITDKTERATLTRDGEQMLQAISG